MALNWNWKDKIGEVTLVQGDREFTMNLYQGNAYLIFISEWKQEGSEMYDVWSFWIDKHHAKSCLGLIENADGEYENIYEEGYQKITKFRFDKKKTEHFTEIAGLILKAFSEITIETY